MENPNWDALIKQCMNCTGCKLAETRNNVVVGTGNPQSEIMFIGEGPGEQEDLKGEPFVGRAGGFKRRALCRAGRSAIG